MGGVLSSGGGGGDERVVEVGHGQGVRRRGMVVETVS